MKTNYFFLLVFVLALASGIYFFKDEIFGPKELEAWSFVPENAVFVWETQSTIDVWNRFINTDHWKNILQIPAFSNINSDLKLLDSLAGSNGNLDQILQTGQFLISTHSVSRDRFDHVFYLELTEEKFGDIALQITDEFRGKKNISFSERSYHDQLIIEIKDSSSKRSFSYFVRDNFFVASFTPFLIEDAIRTFRKETDGFREKNAQAFELASLQFDAGNLYINLENLSAFSGLFFKDQNEDFLNSMRSLSGAGFMDIDFDKSYIFANGFLVPGSDSSYLSVFRNQSPVPTDFSDYIPGNTSHVFYQCFTNAGDWYNAIRDYWMADNSNFKSRLDSLNEIYGFDINRTLSWMGSKLILINLESVDVTSNKLVLIESKDVYESLNQLNRISEQVNRINGDTLYYENYGEATIRLLNLMDFPQQLFGRWFDGFPVTYYTLLEPYVVLSNDVEPIKELITDRETENTWGQSLSKSEFVSNTLDESNMGYMVNTARAWNHVQNKLLPYWKKGWIDHSRSIKQIELASLQISRSAEKFYGSLVLKSRGGVLLDISTSTAEKVLALSMGNRIVKKPKVTRNHNNGSWEIITFDSLNRVSLIDTRGRLVWQKFLESPIRDAVYQVDYFNNRKLQYLLATDSLLHIIDRNGRYVDNFPVDISDIQTDELDVIDYDNSKKYRFMLSEESGNIYLLDKSGRRLEGWSPKSFSGRFSIYPFHVRVRGRDVFLGIKENGEIIATNRRGENIEGFPVDLDVRIDGDIFYQIKSGFDRTIFTVVSEEGEIIRFNLEGTIVEREQLYRPATDTRFWLVKESLGKTYLIARQDLNRLAILDNNGELKFEKDYFSNDPFYVQYYNFGAGQEMVCVSNAEEDEILIYNSDGTLLVPGLRSDFPVSIIHFESRGQYHIYTAAKDSLNIFSIKE